MNKLFSIGATGNIGTHLTNYFQELGVPFAAGASTIEKQEFPTARIDYNKV